MLDIVLTISNQDQADAILDVIRKADDDGNFDFSFNVKTLKTPLGVSEHSEETIGDDVLRLTGFDYDG